MHVVSKSLSTRYSVITDGKVVILEERKLADITDTRKKSMSIV